MDIITIVMTALGLSMDAFAVAISSGMAIKNLKVKHAIKISGFFGGFQGLMPILGWLLGLGFKDYIERYDHWVAFGLLCFIGVKMLKEAMEEDCEYILNPLKNKVLIMLAIATSIDAMAVGVGFAFLKVSILSSAAIIGIITFAVCFGGVYLGQKCGCIFKKRAEVAGGIILMLIGFKILMEDSNLASFVLNIFR
jgi:putative Mn2+ efflux pump MntP